MSQQINIYEAKTNLSKLIDRVLAGEQITIARAGRPVVDLVVHTGRGVIFGGLKGQIHFDQDEFDAADAEIAAMFDFNKDPMLLCDTAVLLWLVIDSPRLGAVSRDRIAGTTAVHVSALSVAEIVIKQMLGKLTAPDDLPAAIERQGLRPLPLDIQDADALREFPELVGHDPFDRMLVAQAHARGMDFLTSDRRLLALGRANIFDATT